MPVRQVFTMRRQYASRSFVFKDFTAATNESRAKTVLKAHEPIPLVLIRLLMANIFNFAVKH